MTQIHSFPSTDGMNRALELQKLIPNSLSGALQYARARFKPINATSGRPLGGWSQFLEDNDDPSVTGTSCMISTMIFCGENLNSSIIAPAKHFIINKQRHDGGWSKPSLEASHSLVLMTCQALGALLDVDELPTSHSIQSAVTWLMEAQNVDGGWGYLACDGISDVTSTAYAMKTLARVMSFYQTAKEVIANGQTWLEKGKNPDASWGRYMGQSGTLAHTSHAVEALVAVGNHSSTLLSTREWIEKNYKDGDQFQDLYRVKTTHERLSWSHMSNERSLIALLKLGAAITAPEVIENAQAILGRQLNGAYWTNELNTNPGASWAISEAVASLRLYLNRLENETAIFMLRTELSNWESIITEYGKRIDVLEEKLDAYSLKSIAKRFVAFLRRPGIGWGGLTAVLLLVYLVLRLVLNFPIIVDIFTAVLTIVAVVLTLVGMRNGTPH